MHAFYLKHKGETFSWNWQNINLRAFHDDVFGQIIMFKIILISICGYKGGVNSAQKGPKK